VHRDKEHHKLIKHQKHRIKKLKREKRKQEKQLDKLKAKLEVKKESESATPHAVDPSRLPTQQSTTTVVQHEEVPVMVGGDGQEMHGSADMSAAGSSIPANLPMPPVMPYSTVSGGSVPLGAFSGSVPGSMSMAAPMPVMSSGSALYSMGSSGSLSSAVQGGLSSAHSSLLSGSGSSGQPQETLALVKLLGPQSGGGPITTMVTARDQLGSGSDSLLSNGGTSATGSVVATSSESI